MRQLSDHFARNVQITEHRDRHRTRRCFAEDYAPLFVSDKLIRRVYEMQILFAGSRASSTGFEIKSARASLCSFSRSCSSNATVLCSSRVSVSVALVNGEPRAAPRIYIGRDSRKRVERVHLTQAKHAVSAFHCIVTLSNYWRTRKTNADWRAGEGDAGEDAMQKANGRRRRRSEGEVRDECETRGSN